MPLRAILRFLLQNEQLIQKLSESYLMRRAAQMTAYFLMKGKSKGEGIVHEAEKRLSSFNNTFTKELKDGWNEAQKQIKKPPR